MNKNGLVKIEWAFASVSDKEGLPELALALAEYGIKIISTGGTAKVLRDVHPDVMDVSDYTGFPEIMDGRVKSLHPKVHGGILGRPGVDDEVMRGHGILPIGLVVVNLYPFEDVVAQGADFDECIENIDIGGPAMIRAAAKNHEHVAVLTDPEQYSDIIEELSANGGALSLQRRQKLASSAFTLTADYDVAVTKFLEQNFG